ncbi:Cuticle protein 3 [Papilio machaon]|uniref:Cuticle protein 3 n=1 Tax=Papilio machaon TaxID=76193 RepID=A0A194QX24_PAPMA|nr:Cuticle protein 3 [Papilio machaon]
MRINRGGKLRLTSFENSPPTCHTNIAMQLVLIATLFGFAASAFAPTYESNRPQASLEKNARILAYDADVKEDSYRFNYETENGIKAEEQGQEVEGIEAQGGFQYTGDDGQVYAISYSAGQAGFQPQGAHLPTAPPTPEAILKALAQNAADEAAGIIDDGQYNPGKYGGGQQQQYRAQSTGFRQAYKF